MYQKKRRTASDIQGRDGKTNQEKKAYLGQYRANEWEIRRLQDELADIRAQEQRLDRLFGGASYAGMRSLDELDMRIRECLHEHVALRDEIESTIRTVPEERLRTLLRFRHINGWTLERIAGEMNYSYMQICRLHGKALSEMML